MKFTYSINTRELAKGKTESTLSNCDFGWENRTTNIAEFLQYAAVDGNAIMPGVLRNQSRRADNISKFCIVIVDVDNKPTGSTMSFDEAMENQWLMDNAVCMWSSPNSGKLEPNSDNYCGQDRYRILFKLEKDFHICDKGFNPLAHRTDKEEIKKVLDTLHQNIDGGDPDMVWCNPIFGTIGASDVHTFDEANTLDIDQLGINTTVVEKVVLPRNQSSFNGSKEQSISNIRDKFLAVIPSDGHDVWKSVGAMLGNIAYHDLDYETCLNLYQEWSARDYPETKEEENQRMFDKAYDNPGDGSSFTGLKNLAMQYGYEPYETEAVDVNPVDLFGTTEGYKAGDVVQSNKQPGLVVAGDKIFITDKRGTTHEISYAQQMTLMTRHVIPAIEAVTNAHEYRFNTATLGVMCDGVEMTGEELDNIQYALSREYSINFPRDTKGALTRIAMENPFDPYEEELLKIEEDVTPIDISNIATRYFKSDTPLADVMMEKWLVGLVGRILQPGLPKRGTLVVVGKQDIGKDGFINTLCGGSGRVVSVGSKTNLKDLNFMLSLSTAWVANLDEIERVTRNQLEGELKSWMTQTEDRLTLKYKNYGQTMPRRFSLYGSCNQAQFLQDPTGNTRYWVMETPLDYANKGERVDLKMLTEEREAILAGAIAKFRLFQQGEYDIELSHTESRASEEFNKGFVEDAAYVETLGAFLEGRTTTCMGEIYQVLGVDSRAQFDKRLTNQVKLSLDQLGWTKMKSPTTVHKKGFKKFSAKLIVQDPTVVNTEELFEFYQQKGQKWFKVDYPTSRVVDSIDF